ncbi:CRISPR-associated endoribonuclease Cas6 [Acetomicrobium sp.]|uniref:CRISPR-associated endoribonuclease Cas6 n=1 Tax=Acetomicrobium sp. TaxID=1872099 RepID=UPI002FC9F3E6
MRITIEFSPQSEKLTLPIHYNSLIQGLIYNNLDGLVSDRLHNEGLAFGKRQFRFFTFSRLYGRYLIGRETIEFTGPLKVHVSSIHEDILESFVKHLLIKGKIQLGSQECELVRIDVEERPNFTRPIKVKTLSPITVYSTLTTGSGRKKTYYYSPAERDWEIQIFANLWRKSQALGLGPNDPAYLAGSRIRPIKVGKQDLRIMKYRDTVIKGWTGIYELDLPEEFFYLAYDAGLGAKNSQGFGMIKVTNSQ